MKKVNCRKCNSVIFAEYEETAISDLNVPKSMKSKGIKYFSELSEYPTDTCHTAIYLTCENYHCQRYYCKIDIK